MAVTLNEMLKVAKTDYAAMIIQDLLRKSDVFKLLPVADVQGLRIVGTRWQTLPTTGKRKIGGGYTEATGAVEAVEETLSIYGGDVQIDRIFTKVPSLFQDELSLQTDMLTESVARSVNNDLINGDHGVDPDGFEGLKKRVANMPARYTITLESGGVTLDVLASSANQQKFIDALHKAKKFIGGAVDAWLCNETAFVGFGQTLRRMALLDTTQDNYDRTWEAFAGGKLVDVGLKQDLSTDIILNTEGTDSLSSSIYGVKFGDETGLNAIQLAGTDPMPYDPLTGGEKESTPGYLRRVDWALGLKNFSQNSSIVRVTGHKFV